MGSCRVVYIKGVKRRRGVINGFNDLLGFGAFKRIIILELFPGSSG